MNILHDEPAYYWTVDGVPACATPLTVSPEFDPPFCCAGSQKIVTRMVTRFRKLRPGHRTEIHRGHCPENGRGREGKWDT